MDKKRSEVGKLRIGHEDHISIYDWQKNGGK
jgi:hypothetical protein